MDQTQGQTLLTYVCLLLFPHKGGKTLLYLATDCKEGMFSRNIP